MRCVAVDPPDPVCAKVSVAIIQALCRSAAVLRLLLKASGCAPTLRRSALMSSSMYCSRALAADIGPPCCNRSGHGPSSGLFMMQRGEQQIRGKCDTTEMVAIRGVLVSHSPCVNYHVVGWGVGILCDFISPG